MRLFFAVNDVMAVGATAALRDQGYEVPRDMAIAGFDDIPTLRDVRPALTTVRLPLVEIGRRALELGTRRRRKQHRRRTGRTDPGCGTGRGRCPGQHSTAGMTTGIAHAASAVGPLHRDRTFCDPPCRSHLDSVVSWWLVIIVRPFVRWGMACRWWCRCVRSGWSIRWCVGRCGWCGGRRGFWRGGRCGICRRGFRWWWVLRGRG